MVNEIVGAAWERPGVERDAFLQQACGSDTALRAEVDALLTSDRHAEDFLQTPGESSSGMPLIAAFASAAGETSAPGDDLVGTSIGRYTITGLIGKGGMGAVYRAVRTGDFRMQVAVKVLKRGTDTDAALKRFRVERQILTRLQHPNIAHLLDGGTAGSGLPYLAMEHVDGAPLMQYASALPLKHRLELFRAVCDAVQYAHERRVVHRDIKPANILVTADGVPKLLDFGIAKLLDPTAENLTMATTATGGRLMTPAYASPEQIRGEPVTAATDIYSLGAVLYELLTGYPPHRFDSRSPDAIYQEVCELDPPWPSALVKNLDRDLDSIVRMAMHKDAARRYRSARELSEDLGRFLCGTPVRARRDSLFYRGRKYYSRKRGYLVAIAASAAVVSLAIYLTGGAFARFGAASAVQSIAVLPLENLSGDREQDYFSDGMTAALIDDLARIRSLRVISRTSVMTFKGARRPLPEIARALGVGRIAEGTVLQSGTRVRITVRLLDANQDRQLWSGSYEGESKDVLALEQSVSDAVAGEIGTALTAPERIGLRRSHKVDVAAYDSYLRGRQQYLTDFNDLPSLEKSIALFQEALRLDPKYAPAYAGLAEVYYMASSRFYPAVEAMPKARSAALKAIELDDTLSDAHATLGLIRSVFDYQRAEAAKEFKRALDLNPSDAVAHVWYGFHLVGSGRPADGIAQAEQARKLDPVSPGLNSYIGALLFYAHRYDAMILLMREIVERYPTMLEPRWWTSMAYAQKGEYAKAIPLVESCCSKLRNPMTDDTQAFAQVGYMFAVSGRVDEARRMLVQLEELSAKRYIGPFTTAVLCAGLGEREKAFRWLQQALNEREEEMAYLNLDPRLDVLHSDSRWPVLLRAIGLAR